jgi:hypothetical protein
MPESTLVWVSVLKLLLIVAFALCYILGGRSGKWRRRWVGGLGLAAGLNLLAAYQDAWSGWLLLLFGTLVLALSLGYGGTTRTQKITRRLIYGLALGLASLPLALASGLWVAWGFQALLALVASLWLGLANPIKAVEEETLIATLSVVVTPFLL